MNLMVPVRLSILIHIVAGHLALLERNCARRTVTAYSHEAGEALPHDLSHYFLFGRWVSAEAAADFAAALDFGSRRTCAAADAAFALVTSLLAIKITSFHAD